MTKDEQFDTVRRDILDNIHSWSDLYEFFDALMAKVRDTMHPQAVMDALFMMYAFMHSMRELPEEGDIKVLAERMLRIMIYQGDEKLGADISVVSKDEVNATRVAVAVAQALQERERDPHNVH